MANGEIHNPWREVSQVNPQRDNGHRRINNEIWAALVRAGLPGSVYQIVMHVIDRSWGYDQLEATIGYSQFHKATGLSRWGIAKAIKMAEEKRLLVIKHGSTTGREPSRYLFNKHYDTWLTRQLMVTSQQELPTTSQQELPTHRQHPKAKVSYPTKRTENITESILPKDIDKKIKNDDYLLTCGQSVGSAKRLLSDPSTPERIKQNLRYQLRTEAGIEVHDASSHASRKGKRVKDTTAAG